LNLVAVWLESVGMDIGTDSFTFRPGGKMTMDGGVVFFFPVSVSLLGSLVPILLSILDSIAIILTVISLEEDGLRGAATRGAARPAWMGPEVACSSCSARARDVRMPLRILTAALRVAGGVAAVFSS